MLGSLLEFGELSVNTTDKVPHTQRAHCYRPRDLAIGFLKVQIWANPGF